ncbi:hypothetical protein ON010_g11230 [Phytophthora cinnamomi]|nr:hypothetical protein ON010_g11230 [Phytophthora cinnamomi]
MAYLLRGTDSTPGSRRMMAVSTPPSTPMPGLALPMTSLAGVSVQQPPSPAVPVHRFGSGVPAANVSAGVQVPVVNAVSQVAPPRSSTDVNKTPPKMEGSFNIYGAQVKAYLHQFNAWGLVDGTIVHLAVSGPAQQHSRGSWLLAHGQRSSKNTLKSETEMDELVRDEDEATRKIMHVAKKQKTDNDSGLQNSGVQPSTGKTGGKSYDKSVGSKRKKGVCFYCGKEGHYQNMCRKQQFDLKHGTAGGQNKVLEASPMVRWQEARSKRRSLSAITIRNDWTSGNTYAIASSGLSIASPPNVPNSLKWILDSAAITHTCADRSLMLRFPHFEEANTPHESWTGAFTREHLVSELEISFVSTEDQRGKSGGKLWYTLTGLWRKSVGGKIKFELVEDEYSRYLWGFLLQQKSESGDNLKTSILQLHQSGRRVKFIGSDQGTEFKNEALKKYMWETGIRPVRTNTYSPEENSLVEKMNSVMLRAVRTMLVTTGLPTSLWGEGLKFAVTIYNFSPTKVNQGCTPDELYEGRKPDVSGLRRYGEIEATEAASNPKRHKCTGELALSDDAENSNGSLPGSDDSTEDGDQQQDVEAITGPDRDKWLEAREVPKERNVDTGGSSTPNSKVMTISMEAIRVVIVLAFYYDLGLHQIDFTTSFLNGYMDAPLIWNETLKKYSVKLSFKASVIADGVYVKWIGDTPMFLTVYVDDVVIAAKTEHIEWLIEELKKEFQLKDLGELNLLLAMDVKVETDRVTLSQESYVRHFVEKFGVCDARVACTPMYMKVRPAKPKEPLVAVSSTLYAAQHSECSFNSE